jgi:hypothetical protein
MKVWVHIEPTIGLGFEKVFYYGAPWSLLEFGFRNCMEYFVGLGPRKFGVKMVPCRC